MAKRLPLLLGWAGFVVSVIMIAGANAGIIGVNDSMTRSILSLLSYIPSIVLARRIRRDHVSPSAMYRAWTLIEAACWMGAIRFTYEALANAGILGLPGPMIGLRQIPNVLHSALILAGVVTMWSALSLFRAGKPLRWKHRGAIGLILLLTPFLWLLSDRLPDGSSPFLFIRLLQGLDPMLLMMGAAIAVSLHRISQDIRGGELALSLKFLVAFLICKCAAFVLRLLFLPSHPLAPVLIGIAFASAWLLTLSTIHRWRLTVKAEGLTRQYAKWETAVTPKA